MKQHGLDRFLFYASVACFGLHAISLMLMAPKLEQISGILVLAGLLFWIPLLLGILAQIMLGIRAGQWRRAQKRRPRNHRLGLLNFFSNRVGAVFDLAFLVSGAVFAISQIFSENSGIFPYISVSFFVFFFETHCIFNGKNYNYIMQSMWVGPKYLRQQAAGTRRKTNDKEQNNNL